MCLSSIHHQLSPVDALSLVQYEQHWVDHMKLYWMSDLVHDDDDVMQAVADDHVEINQSSGVEERVCISIVTSII